MGMMSRMFWGSEVEKVESLSDPFLRGKKNTLSSLSVKCLESTADKNHPMHHDPESPSPTPCASLAYLSNQEKRKEIEKKETSEKGDVPAIVLVRLPCRPSHVFPTYLPAPGLVQSSANLARRPKGTNGEFVNRS